jgi:hypothetical protein
MHHNTIANSVYDRTKEAIQVISAGSLDVGEVLPTSGGATGEQTSITSTAVQFVAANTGRQSGVLVRNKGTENLGIGFNNTTLLLLLKPDEWAVVPTAQALWVKNLVGTSGSLCYLEC